jgi:hypothetical protein
VALRIVASRLSAMRDVVVGAIERPQSKNSDFYPTVRLCRVGFRESRMWKVESG